MPRTQGASVAIRMALALIGFSAVIGQVVLLRELMVLFNGTELCLGIALATWLLWTAAGSGLASYLPGDDFNLRKIVAWIEFLVGGSLLPTVWLLRSSKAIIQAVPGELVGLAPMLLTSLLCLSVFCALSGFLFVAAARMFRQECGVSDRFAISSAYLFEAVGSGLGGILGSLLLLRYLEAFQIAIIIALLNICMALWFFSKQCRNAVIATLAVVVLSIPLLTFWALYLNRSTQQRLWQGFRVVGTKDSIYGSFVVLENGGIFSIYDNGMLLANVPDQNAAEESVHYALLQHPAPGRILLIGGGGNGSIAEALKHPGLERLDYVEPDPMLIHLFQRFIPEQARLFFSDPRVHIHNVDGRYYLRTAPGRFDVIILNLPEPQTAQLNRFYTVEFFHLVREHLAEGGVFAMQLPASENYISPRLQEFLQCIHATLRQVFPYIVILPGDTLHFFAAMRPNVLTADAATLISRLENRHLQTQYVREYFLPFRMMPDRLAGAKELLQPTHGTPINRDFAPVAYYFDIVLWSTRFRHDSAFLFPPAMHWRFLPLSIGLLFFFIVAVVTSRLLSGSKRQGQIMAISLIASTGFTLMALQILVLLAFQAVYGHVYYQLALLIAMFMAGLAAGSWLRMRGFNNANRLSAKKAAILAQCLLVVSLPAALLVILGLSRLTSLPGMFLATEIAFPGLAIACGILGGYQFSSVVEIYLDGGRQSTAAGVLYAADLLGGCIGALLLGSYLLPLFGFWRTAWFTATINLIPILLALGWRQEKSSVHG